MTSVAVVVPAYNEALTIRGIAERVLELPIARLIVVDDGSSDGTASEIAHLDLEILTNPVNQGKGLSLLRGLHHAHQAGYSAVITLDADGQHRPEDIPRLLEQHRRSPDKIVIAARVHGRHKAPPMRRFGNVFADFWISWACGQPVKDSQSGFRLYPSALFDRVTTSASREAGFVFESEILIDAALGGFGSIGIPIDTLYHATGRRSHYQPWPDTWAIVRMIAGKLRRQGFSPRHLWRSLKPVRFDQAESSQL